MHLIKQLDKNLLNLAWSLWTELGVAGNKQNHQNVLILIEELIIFTSVLTEIDPRLRDESLDWCSQFYRYISISRLKSLMKDFEELARKPFSKYASNLNNISKANWPVFIDTPPLKINLSHKSILRPHASSALLNIRARSLFGTGARADLVTFFLVHPNTDFSIAEVAETGYSKRNLAEVLDDLHSGNLFDRFMQGNQQRYRLNKNSPLFQMLKPIPKYAPWHLVFKVLLTIRACIHHTENYSESTKVVELRNCLKEQEKSLQKLELIPPLFQNNFPMYLENCGQWILEWTDLLAKGQIHST
jgi:hypothetical protein